MRQQNCIRELKPSVFHFSLSDQIRAAEGSCCKTSVCSESKFQNGGKYDNASIVVCMETLKAAGDAESLEKAND